MTARAIGRPLALALSAAALAAGCGATDNGQDRANELRDTAQDAVGEVRDQAEQLKIRRRLRRLERDARGRGEDVREEVERLRRELRERLP